MLPLVAVPRLPFSLFIIALSSSSSATSPRLLANDIAACGQVEWLYTELTYGASAVSETSRDGDVMCAPTPPQFWCLPVNLFFGQHFLFEEHNNVEPCNCDRTDAKMRGDTCAISEASALVDCSISSTGCGARFEHRFDVYSSTFVDACEPESCFAACAQAETCWSMFAKFRLLRIARVRLVGNCPYPAMLVRDGDGQTILQLPASAEPLETPSVLLHSSFATGSLYALEGKPLNLFSEIAEDDCPRSQADNRAQRAISGVLELQIEPLPSGDMNCDGAVTHMDIPGFVRALVDPATYPALHPECEIYVGDFTGDGQVSLIDLGHFARLLAS